MYPQYVEVGNKSYKINTDFRVAIECNRIGEDTSIGNLERSLAIIYELFGEDAMNDFEHHEKLLELAREYLSCGEVDEVNKQRKDKRNDLDFNKCEGLIRSSFKFDYQYDPFAKDYLHWYEFNNDLMNLSTSEFGNCCVLNRILDVLNRNPNEIKDKKSKDNLIELQSKLRKKYCVEHKRSITKEQRQSAMELYNALNLGRS